MATTGRADLSADEARRIALAAQGFASRRPTSRVGLSQVRRVASRLRAIQIDAVNVLIRTQYVPAFSRLGPYPIAELDRLVYARRELFEYCAHEAALLPVLLHPLMRWRMKAFASDQRWVKAVPEDYRRRVLAEVTERGPLAARDLSNPGPRRSSGGWGWTAGKAVLDWLHMSGVLAVVDRRGIEQVYDLAERVIPAEVRELPEVPEDDARSELLFLAAKALGVGTAKDLGDYFRIGRGIAGISERANGRKPTPVRSLLADLVDAGRLQSVRVEGWRQPAYRDPGAKLPRLVSARALVSPFDSLVWERERTERIFRFRYRIEIYVPEARREYGSYVLPFLLGDTLVGRVDLKADRKRRVLLVPGVFHEPDQDARHVAGELAAELRLLAEWLELESVEVGGRGNLAGALARAL